MVEPEGEHLDTAPVRGVPLWGVGFALPAFGLVVLARRYGFVEPVPLLVILGELALTLGALAVFTSRFPPGSARARPRLHMGLQVALIGAIVYTLGWGAILAVGFIFPATNIMNSDGSRHGRWAMGCIAVTVLAGELAVGLGLVRSLVPGRTGYGLASLEVAATCAAVWVLTFNQKEKEQAERSVSESEQRFRTLVQHASDIIIVVGPDGTIRYASPAFEETLGYPASQALGMDARVMLADEDTTRLAAMAEVTEPDAAPIRYEVRLRHRDGTWRWCETTLTRLPDVSGFEGWVANLRDITERKEAEAAQRATDAALRQAQEVFRHAFDEAGVAMILVDPDGTIRRANGALARLLAYDHHEDFVGMNVIEITHPEDRTRAGRHLRDLSSGRMDGLQAEKRYIKRDGATAWVALTVSMVRDDAGRAMYSICQLEDITQRKAIADRLAFEAAHDVMTGLSNRATFTERVTTALARGAGPVAVLFVDLDHFKIVNDGLGHAAGDELLISVAQRLRTVIRPGDVVARFGGDEFVVLCEQVTGHEGASQLAHRLMAALAEPLTIGGDEIFVTASVGIALSDVVDTAESLLRQADAAMYQAKNDGRSRAVVFQPEYHGSAAALLKTGNDLHRALERDELAVHYQPIVDLHAGRVVGFEALVRWDHPERGLLMPGDFLGLAEESGLIVPIGTWVLETACHQTVRWQQSCSAAVGAAPLTVNVNLAARQVADPSLAKTVARVLADTGLAPGALCLELTENTLMYDTASTIEVLHALRGQGVHLSIDDFGTGYSSLSYLKRFPVETLKIDRSFIAGLGSDLEDSSIVHTVVTLAHSLNVAAVAEGVETPVQLDILRTLGCDYAQGYLFGRPQPAEAIGAHPAEDLAAWQGLPLTSAQ
jgi:diguanylate cyclase (GGDEF)-like protein/PAS domain S-box-containing protein